LLNNLLVIIIIDVEEKTCGSSCIIGIWQSFASEFHDRPWTHKIILFFLLCSVITQPPFFFFFFFCWESKSDSSPLLRFTTFLLPREGRRGEKCTNNNRESRLTQKTFRVVYIYKRIRRYG
jgi:hypothetical protein